MGGIYGEQLLFFPELIQEYEVFKLSPKVSGGFKPRKPVCEVSGIFLKNATGDMEVAGDATVANQRGKFWVLTEDNDTIPKQGACIEYKEQIFKFIYSAIYTEIAGFIGYKMQLVAGVTDQQVPIPEVETGIINDY